MTWDEVKKRLLLYASTFVARPKRHCTLVSVACRLYRPHQKRPRGNGSTTAEGDKDVNGYEGRASTARGDEGYLSSKWWWYGWPEGW